MPKNTDSIPNRRDFIKTSGKVTAASALAGVALPHVHANVDDTVKVALVGAGGRGNGAANNALSVSAGHGPTKLVAIADIFDEKLQSSYNGLKKRFKDKVDLGKEGKNGRPERGYIGFDGYKNAIDNLSKGDVAIFTTPPAFRWVFYKYAVEKGINVFMEKPVTADGYGTKKILEINKVAKKKNLKVGVGLMCRHSRARGAMADKIQEGAIGDVVLMRSYRMHGPVASSRTIPQRMRNEYKDLEEIRWQIRRFHSFIWASGGCFNDFYIHNIDECCWMKDAWPVNAIASGGRHYRDNYVDQNFDTYSVEYTFDDGTKLYLDGRNMDGCHQEFASYAHGSRGSAIISAAAHTPAKSRIFKGQNFVDDEIAWQFDGDEPNPYQLEWDHLIEAIRQDSPYNEVRRGVQASVVTAMGRLSAHTGQRVTYDEMLNHEHELAPQISNLTMDSDAPVQCDENGAYPTPLPGIIQDREYYSFSETSDETASPVEADVSGETEATDDS